MLTNYVNRVLDELIFSQISFGKNQILPTFPMTKKINYHFLRIMLILRISSETQFDAFFSFAQTNHNTSCRCFNNISLLSTAYFRSIGTQIMTESRAYEAPLFAVTKAKRMATTAHIKWIRRVNANKISSHTLCTVRISCCGKMWQNLCDRFLHGAKVN